MFPVEIYCLDILPALLSASKQTPKMWNENDLQVVRPYVVTDQEHRGGLDKLLKDLAVVSIDPTKPKKKGVTKNKLRILRMDEVQLE